MYVHSQKLHHPVNFGRPFQIKLNYLFTQQIQKSIDPNLGN
jgi:hypothetical protein